ncbi:hypothetical protein EGH21_19705 [Halomicroarcula sp. F13]|uniref:Uncharacterized protein n=1 Tax=Haloarcula rubra TaxID=2487747 RepID=A0AAW4PVA9_9EURY|nr:hypothetical protein [Halomicroarcula rubra]MBX0325256.1 hypothetical protein [Halomicroarcula rubra]
MEFARRLTRQGTVDRSEAARFEPRQCLGSLECNQFLLLMPVHYTVDIAVGMDSEFTVVVDIDLNPFRKDATADSENERSAREVWDVSDNSISKRLAGVLMNSAERSLVIRVIPSTSNTLALAFIENHPTSSELMMNSLTR